MVLLSYPGCSTCAKAEKWLKDNNFEYIYRNIKDENPSKEELVEWHKQSGMPLKRFFNSSGLVYREKELSRKLPDMSDDDQYTLLSEDGMLVKRPILIDGHIVIVGFNEKAWADVLL